MQADRRAFLRALVGNPYEAGGNGPSWDCYGLARHVLQNLFSVSLPTDPHAPVSRHAWRRVVHPADGAICLMGQTDKHIGVWISGGVLHAMEGIGVVFDDVHSLRLRGFGKIRMYVPQ